MTYSTSDTYQMKREILNFSHKISRNLPKPDRKFSADITYGMDHDYVIRLTAKRKLLYHNKLVPATQLGNRRKGKVKLPLFYKGKEHEEDVPV